MIWIQAAAKSVSSNGHIFKLTIRIRTKKADHGTGRPNLKADNHMKQG